MGPLGGVAFGDHVGVALEQETSPRVLITEPRDDVGAAGSDLVHLDGEAVLREPTLDGLCDGGTAPKMPFAASTSRAPSRLSSKTAPMIVNPIARLAFQRGLRLNPST